MVYVFDLDDTLYSEFDFVKSGMRHVMNELQNRGIKDILKYKELLSNSKDWIDRLLLNPAVAALGKGELLALYRNHFPEIQCYPDAFKFLTRLKTEGTLIALITDGRSSTQRNKIKALGLDHFFDVVVISEEIGSEKPNSANYLPIQVKWPGNSYCYFGDNVRKDFIGPKKLGWKTVGLRDRGCNIHTQLVSMTDLHQPESWITNFDDY